MKKLALLFVFVQSLVFANDPVITLNGDSVIEIYMGSTFVDPGAYATDEEDGDISNSIQVSGSVDTNTHGTYVLAYNVTDSDGNSASVVVRTINVVDDAKPSIDVKIFYLYDGSHTDPDLVDPGNRIEYFIELWNTGNTDLTEFVINNLVATDLNGNSVPLTSGPSWGGGNDIEGYSYPGEMHLYIATLHISETTYGSGGVNLQAYGHGSGQFQGVSLARDLTLSFGTSSDEIILDGQISANNNQIKKVADPTDNLDAVNKRYVDQRTLEQTIPGQNIGDLLYWNGQSWQKLSAPQEQSTLRFCEGQLTWGPCAPEVYITHFDSSNSVIGVYGKLLFNGVLYNELGVVYSKTTQSPTVNDSKFLDDEDVYRPDTFAIYVNEFDLESTYFVRAYCISDKGVSYSKEVFSFTTGSLGNSQAGDYKKYGDQHWTVENYAGIFYQDGTYIPQVTDATEWANLTTGAWCYYDNDPNKGMLYNWYAVMGIHDNDPNTPNKEFAPEGWHVPTDAEWTTLENYLITNGYNYDGTTTENKIAKAMASTTGWNHSTNTGAPGNDQSLNNISGFNALPEGKRHIDGWFSGEGNEVVFWSTTESTPLAGVWERGLFNWAKQLNRISRGDSTGSSTGPKRHGFSVRLVKD